MTDPAMTVRRAASDDVQAVAQVHQESWRVAYVDLLSAEVIAEAVPIRCSIERWQSIFAALASTSSEVFLAERDERAIGFVHLGPGERDNTLGELYRFYLIPSEWGKGAAQMLMNAALIKLTEVGRSTVTLWTPATPRARRFYERNGFSSTGADMALTLFGDVQVTDYEFVRMPVQAIAK